MKLSIKGDEWVHPLGHLSLVFKLINATPELVVKLSDCPNKATLSGSKIARLRSELHVCHG